MTGGFIFPLFMAGASLGRGLAQIRGIPFISDVPPVLLAMSIATGAVQMFPCCLIPSETFPGSDASSHPGRRGHAQVQWLQVRYFRHA